MGFLFLSLPAEIAALDHVGFQFKQLRATVLQFSHHKFPARFHD